jgi:hypothetical protein
MAVGGRELDPAHSILWSLYGGLREERSAGLGIAIARVGEGEGRGERDEPGRKALCYCSARCGGRLWMTALDARLNLNLNLNSNKSAMQKGQVEPASCFLLLLLLLLPRFTVGGLPHTSLHLT